MAKPKMKSKPKKNGVSKPNGVSKKNGHVKTTAIVQTAPVVSAAALVVAEVPTPVFGPPPIDPSIGRFRAMKQEMESEIREFKEYLVGKYTNFNGHDLRKDVAWFMEQMGTSIASDLERIKREDRQRLIAENQAKEKLMLLDEAKK